MINYARITALSLILTLAGSHAMALEQTPVGEWLVKDKTAHMRIVGCGPKLWGVISWVTEPDTDKNNPDASKRDRPILGLPILLGMAQGEQGWDGNIYNAENGKIYKSNIALQSKDVLHVKGCVLGGLFCGGEDWTRLQTPAKQESAQALCKRVVQP